uniref:2'-deoxynucleoside 5'-phosphate N-hydrolase 1 n=1 Tax=Ovis aries TaxID=9940 RepID=A0AC11ESI6_SHEEP
EQDGRRPRWLLLSHLARSFPLTLEVSALLDPTDPRSREHRLSGPLILLVLRRGEEAAGGDKLIHDRDVAWLQQADVVVAEVTQPSLGVGYELGRAVALRKPVLCLFRPKSGRVLSAMIRGAADGSKFQVWDYKEAEVEALLDRYFEAYHPKQVAASPDPTA